MTFFIVIFFLKRLTARVRHREIDGTIHWSSLCPKLRRDFEREGARIFSGSQWLGNVQRGRNRPRFQCCADSNNNLSFVSTPQEQVEDFSGRSLLG